MNRHGRENTDETPCGMIRDGIVVLTRDAVMPDGTQFD